MPCDDRRATRRPGDDSGDCCRARSGTRPSAPASSRSRRPPSTRTIAASTRAMKRPAVVEDLVLRHRRPGAASSRRHLEEQRLHLALGCAMRRIPTLERDPHRARTANTLGPRASANMRMRRLVRDQPLAAHGLQHGLDEVRTAVDAGQLQRHTLGPVHRKVVDQLDVVRARSRVRSCTTRSCWVVRSQRGHVTSSSCRVGASHVVVRSRGAMRHGRVRRAARHAARSRPLPARRHTRESVHAAIQQTPRRGARRSI